ncbi:MAG TPA: hypothetical protein VGB13_01045, partial [Candidatus Krumholzibacteria bacterium]
MTANIVFEILTWWHAGTGRGDGSVADAVLARADDGLPCLPGRTVKGLARDAVRLGAEAGMATRDQLAAWFGTDIVTGNAENRVEKLEAARFCTNPGSLRFESATLGKEWTKWARAHESERNALVSTFASTRIGAEGVAVDQTLRVIEVALPLTLRAPVEGLESDSRRVLEAVLPLFVRGLGSHRNRGL